MLENYWKEFGNFFFFWLNLDNTSQCRTIHLTNVHSPAFYRRYICQSIYLYKGKGGSRASHPKAHFEVTARIIANAAFFIAMAQEHPFGKCGKFQKSPFSGWSFSPLLVCTKAIHITAISPLFPLLLPASKPFRLKKRKENSYLLVYWGCVLPIYHVCIYLWVKIVSLVLFEAGGECFKKNMVWEICFFVVLFFFS